MNTDHAISNYGIRLLGSGCRINPRIGAATRQITMTARSVEPEEARTAQSPQAGKVTRCTYLMDRSGSPFSSASSQPFLSFCQAYSSRQPRQTKTIATDGLPSCKPSYKAAMSELGNQQRQEIHRWSNDRVENSHPPFRRRERATPRFRRMKSLQKLAAVHAKIQNPSGSDRHLTDRPTYKTSHSAAMAQRQSPMARPKARVGRLMSSGDELAPD